MRTAHHHIKRLHRHRVSWFGVLAAGLIAIQFGVLVSQPKTADQVLAYATSVSQSELLAQTNAARAANGLGALALHEKLNSSSLAKANDMVTKNYWSHNAPDGTQPWVFFNQAGYGYSRAGENLAYGFDSSAEIVEAWMNSAGHRANILGQFSDVGFGITNGAGYQNGDFTVVVAHYGQPAAPPPAVAQQQTPPPAPAPTPEPQPEPAPTPAAPEPVKPEPTPEVVQTTPTQTVTEAPKTVTALDLLANGQATWPIYASLGFIGLTTLGFAATHWQLMRRGWAAGSRFVMLHPLLDAAVIAAIAALILSTTAGFIR